MAENGEKKVCQVQMYGNQPCGREIWDQDEQKCIFHSSKVDQKKNLFLHELEKYIKEVESKKDVEYYDFSHFVFCEISFADRVFSKPVDFILAEFQNVADFSGAEFQNEAYFFGAKFQNKATFIRAEFQNKAAFIRAKFQNKAAFSDAQFQNEAHFSDAQFQNEAHFSYAEFQNVAYFSGAKFQKQALFSGAEFHEKADLGRTSFYEETAFYRTIFHKVASFHSARIYGIFNFEQINQIEGQRFPDYSLDFRNVTIGQTAQARMATVNLKKALFLRTDLSNIQFFEAVWQDKSEKFFTRRTILYDEIFYFEERAKKTSDDRVINSGPSSGNLLNIEYLYRQLKKNYDDKTDYTAGGQFHIGEMETKYKRATLSPIVKPVFWLLSPTAWYKRVSMYGESYWRASASIFLAWFVFTWLFMVAGLSTPGESGRIVMDYHFGGYFPVLESEFWNDTFKALKHTLSIFYFARFQYLQPNEPWGPYLNIFGYVVSVTLHALFLLALRRRFKR